MKMQVLVATMHRKDHDLLEQMNIQCDAVVGNQCDENRVEHFTWEGRDITWLSFAERGVGLNRNTALQRATADVCLFADDDMRYYDGYTDMVERAFRQKPDADGFIFNVDTLGGDRKRRMNHAVKRVRWYNALNYSAPRIVVKNEAILRENLCFHRCFGGGTSYSCGEDTLFITDMLKRGLKLYTWPESLAQVDQSDSSWFMGYNEKFLYDKGVLFRAVSRRWNWLLCLQDLVRHPHNYRNGGFTFRQAWRLMRRGAKGFNQLRSYKA